MSTALDNMARALDTFRERNAVYGDNYKKFGAVMAAIFPNGLTLKSADDFNRFGVFFPIMTKITRYAETAQDPEKGRPDSIHDVGVYAFMLEELDAIAKAHRTPFPPTTEDELSNVVGHHQSSSTQTIIIDTAERENVFCPTCKFSLRHCLCRKESSVHPL